MKHAVIVTGGKQYRVAEGDVIYVEKLNAEAGEKVTFDQVLCVVDDANTVIGTPVVDETEKRLSPHAGPQTALYPADRRIHSGVTQSQV